MKKIICLVLSVVLMLSVNITSFAAEDIFVIIDGTYIEFDVKPEIINNRTMVPIRAIFEKMGADVKWDATTKTANCTKGNTVVKMTVGSKSMYVDGQEVKMDTSPIIIKNRTLAPARYVAEAFGADVQWSQKNRTVVISSKGIYAYTDYPDIPDLGRCYNIPVEDEGVQDGYKVFSYLYEDVSNDDYEELYKNSAKVLGKYVEKTVDTTDGVVTTSYTKSGNTEPKYFVAKGKAENGSTIFVVMIPMETAVKKPENKVTLYALDGRTIKVPESEVKAYLNVGWYKTLKETQQTLYAEDGRTITVYKAEVPAYKKVGWYETLAETQQTLYAEDGRTITVNRAEVPAYKKVGWYETLAETQQTLYAADGRTITVNKSEVPAYKDVGWYETRPEASTVNNAENDLSVLNNYSDFNSYSSSNNYSTYNSLPDGNYYRTPTGERYHLDPDCGGKNSYLITEYEAISSGLTPCAKCAE